MSLSNVFDKILFKTIAEYCISFLNNKRDNGNEPRFSESEYKTLHRNLTHQFPGSLHHLSEKELMVVALF